MSKAALLVIDVQKGLADASLGRRNNPQAEANIARLLARWRAQQALIVHVQHASQERDSKLRPELPGYVFKDEAKPMPDEPCFVKSVNSAFVGTELEGFLRDRQVHSLVVVGLTTDHCVSASTRSASDLGFAVTLVSDATATFERVGPVGEYYTAEQMHNVNLASLNGEFCTVRSTEEILAGH